MEPAPIPPPVVRFGVFEADLRSGELRRSGVRIRVQELPFRALRLLVSRPGEVVTRDELRRTLWPEGVHVDFEKGISSTINRLRETLGDTAANPIFVETVERRGYRWIAPVHRDEAASPVPNRESPAPPAQPPRPATVVAISGEPVPAPPPASPARGLRLWLVLAVTALAAVAIVVWIAHRGSPSRSAAPAADPQAEQLYLQGRFYWNQRTPDDLNRAVDYFSRAIARDPGYANAYVGLADCYNLLREFSAMPPEAAFPRALASAKKAVELDPGSADAHASLAFVMFSWNWDRAGAEREFKRALQLDPRNARAHHWWATTLLTLNRPQEALDQIEWAQKLDPTSPAVLADKGLILLYVGRHEESLALLQQVVEQDPKLATPHVYLAILYWRDQDFPKYFAESSKAAELQHNDAALAEYAAAQKGYAASGLPGMYAAQLPLQLSAYQQGRGGAVPLARTYAQLGRRDDALRLLREAYERRELPLLYLADDPDFRVLRGHPEFESLLKQTLSPRE